MYKSPRLALRGREESVSERVIRYDSEEEYVKYMNHRHFLANGKLTDFPDPQKDPDGYWRRYYEEKAVKPDAIFETWTLVNMGTKIDPLLGSIERQDCTYVTLEYPDLEAARVSKKIIEERERPDPGEVITTFDTLPQAEKFRAMVLKEMNKIGEKFYYDIRHATSVSVVDVEDGKAP